MVRLLVLSLQVQLLGLSELSVRERLVNLIARVLYLSFASVNVS